jgi:hypothetical protein
MSEGGQQGGNLYDSAIPKAHRSSISSEALEEFLAESGLGQVVADREKLKQESSRLLRNRLKRDSDAMAR